MSETEEVQTDQRPKTPMEEAAGKVRLDEGAAVVFIGVDECYQNYADPTHMPLNSPAEVQALINNGTLEVVEVDGESSVTGNVGVLGGQDEAALELASVQNEETEEIHDRDVPVVDAPVADKLAETKNELDF